MRACVYVYRVFRYVCEDIKNWWMRWTEKEAKKQKKRGKETNREEKIHAERERETTHF